MSSRPRALASSAAALLFGACRPPARPEAPTAALPAFTAQVTAAATCSMRGAAIGGDGEIAAAIGHRGAISIGLVGARARAGAVAAPLVSLPDAGGPTATIAVFEPGGAKVAWSRSLGGAQPGPIAFAGDELVAAIGATGSLSLDDHAVALRGAPGALAVGLDARTGATRWSVPLGATGWVTVASIAALPAGAGLPGPGPGPGPAPGNDVAIGGSFAGTLRVGASVVTSAGDRDGFVARIGPRGEVRWLLRIGGDGDDGVAGVAALGDRIAVAGTFTGEVDLRGVPLAPIADSPFADGFVAALAGDGRVAWARAFGSAAADQVAGVAVTRSGHIAVAGTVRDIAYLGAGGASVTAGGVEDWSGHGAGDALVAIWDAAGTPVASDLVGGADYDGARSIAARGDELVLGAWFSGRIDVAGHTFHAGGGDDALVVTLDDQAHVRRATALTGDGREDVAALAATDAGWAAAVDFSTATRFDDAALAAPADPDGGCALIVRPR